MSLGVVGVAGWLAQESPLPNDRLQMQRTVGTFVPSQEISRRACRQLGSGNAKQVSGMGGNQRQDLTCRQFAKARKVTDAPVGEVPGAREQLLPRQDDFTLGSDFHSLVPLAVNAWWHASPGADVACKN